MWKLDHADYHSVQHAGIEFSWQTGALWPYADFMGNHQPGASQQLGCNKGCVPPPAWLCRTKPLRLVDLQKPGESHHSSSMF